MGRINIRRGDLVNLHRRKTPGLGIVLEREAHTLQKLETEGVYDLFMEMYVGAPNWRAKKKACDYLIRESELNSDLVYAFLINNAFYGMRRFPDADRFKRDFILVRWLQRPSDYGSNKLSKDISWLPADWFKKLN